VNRVREGGKKVKINISYMKYLCIILAKMKEIMVVKAHGATDR
jgi:hypothetical protein